MAEHFKHDTNADNGDIPSGRRKAVERNKKQSLMTTSKIHSINGKDVLLVILCFALTAIATLISSNFLTRGRQYFVPDAAVHIMICMLSFSGIICLVIMIIVSMRQGRNRVRSQADDDNRKRHEFGSTEKIAVMYIFSFGTLFHILLRIVKITFCIKNGDTEETFSLVMCVSLAIFSTVQLLFFRKYNQYRCKSLKFQIPVILVVCANVSVCLSALIQETVEVLTVLRNNDDHNQDFNASNIVSNHYQCDNSSLAINIEKMSNFLYPLEVEFSLLAIEFMWFISAIPQQHGELVRSADIKRQIYDSSSELESLLNGTRYSLYRKLSKCKWSLTISLIICVSTLIVTFVTYFKERIPHMHSAFVVMELIFSALLFSSCGVGLLRLGSAEDLTKRQTFILGNYVSFFLIVGSVSVYHMFAIISSLTLISSDANIASSLLLYFGLFTEIFHLLAAYLQSLFLGKCSRRTSYGDGTRQQSILRMCVFIAIANSSMWIENSFLPFRKVDDKHLVNVIDSEFYGVTGWVLISKILYPFCIYFRLESVLRCLEIIRRI